MFQAFVAASALVAISAPALAVTSNNAPSPRTYTTEISPIDSFGLPFTGELSLRFYSDGIIQGNYSTLDGPSFVPVTGGRTGDSIWLEIGRMGTFQVNGKLSYGEIVGMAYRRGSNRDYQFVAKPS